MKKEEQESVKDFFSGVSQGKEAETYGEDCLPSELNLGDGGICLVAVIDIFLEGGCQPGGGNARIGIREDRV